MDDVDAPRLRPMPTERTTRAGENRCSCGVASDIVSRLSADARSGALADRVKRLVARDKAIQAGVGLYDF